MTLKIYLYDRCSTCRKALQFLERHKIACTEIPIRETPPTKVEIEQMLRIQGGNLRKLFNTSGRDYRERGIKDRLSGMTTAQAVQLLASNGNLIKRPFALSNSIGLLGFKEEEWRKSLGLRS